MLVMSTGAPCRPKHASGGTDAMSRTLFEIGASVGASAVMLAVTIVGGRLVMAESAPGGVERPAATVGCEERPFAVVNGGAARGMARLCLTRDGVEPIVELAGLPSGVIYSAWIAYVDRPGVVRVGECADPDLPAPGRIASGIADQEGRLMLSSMAPGLQLGANSVVKLLVVEHGALSSDVTPDRARGLLVWQPGWSDATAPSDATQSSGSLLGCSSFWTRGGVDTTEH